MTARRTTKAEYSRFCREARRLIEVLGLKGWRITFRHEDIGEAYGDMRADHESRCAIIRFNRTRQDEPGKETESQPECTGRHEALELFFARLRWLGSCRFSVSPTDLEEETHHLIRTLENLL